MRINWDDIANLMPDAPRVPHAELVLLSEYKKAWRTEACGGVDPLTVVVAYTNHDWYYDECNRLIYASPLEGEARFSYPSSLSSEALAKEEARLENLVRGKTDRKNTPLQDFVSAAEEASPIKSILSPKGRGKDRVNVLGVAYKPDAPLYLHHVLAEICVRAAVEMYHEHGWNMVVFDGLRTMEGHHTLYELTPQAIIDAGMLAKPGRSAHNRAMAVDWMAFDAASGEEIPMGGHFDCPNMQLVHRENKEIEAPWHGNRRKREIAMQRAALSIGTMIAPLREEFWDDRMLGSAQDFWRAIESMARCLDVPAPEEKARDHALFKTQFEAFGRARMEQVFGEDYPVPMLEHIVFHEQYRPIYSAELPVQMQQV